MNCNNNETSCCGACFEGTTHASELVGKTITSAHVKDGRLVVIAGQVNFSEKVSSILGSLGDLVGRQVTHAEVMGGEHVAGTVAGTGTHEWELMEIHCGSKNIKAVR